MWVLGVVLVAGGALAVPACGSSDGDGGTGDGGGGGADGSTTDGGGGGVVTDGSGLGHDGAGNALDGGADAQQGPRDPFQAQWKAARDIPIGADYKVDKAAGTVLDLGTGLTWMYTPVTSANLPPDGGDGSPSTNVEARAQCAAATVGGAKGWRLPTRIELLSITSPDDAHAFNSDAFDAKAYDDLVMWVKTDDPARQTIYDAHYPAYTFRGTNSFFAGALNCVKAPYPVTEHPQPPDPSRFTLASNIMSDHVTGLEWWATLKNAADTWGTASDYCTNLAQGDAGAPSGAKPWRLPTLKEAASLWLESTKTFPKELGITPGTVYFWTSSKYKPPPQIIGVPGYFRLYFDTVPGQMDMWFEVADFAATLCVRDAK
jgi:hypothetical protein